MNRLILPFSALLALASCVQPREKIIILHDTIRETIYVNQTEPIADEPNLTQTDSLPIVSFKETETADFEGLTCKRYVASCGKTVDDIEFSRNHSILFPTDHKDKEVLANMQMEILKRVNLDSTNFDIQKNMVSQMENEYRSHFSSNASVTDKASTETSVEFYNGKILCYKIFSSYYGGGAHEMQGCTYINFDMTDGLTVSSSDIFKNGYKKGLSKILRERAKTTNNWSEEDLIDMLHSPDDIEASDVFRISTEGITFIYNPYEIGPYSSGVIEITVPFNEIKDFVKNAEIFEGLF